MSIAEIEAEALKLAPEDQARLLQRLATALDIVGEPDLSDEELEKRWANFTASGSQGIESSELRAHALSRYPMG